MIVTFLGELWVTQLSLGVIYSTLDLGILEGLGLDEH